MSMFESRGIDPRSVQIAGVVTAALVVLGLLVSHAAKPDAERAPALSSKVAPGAAAVEATEDIPVPAPTQPSAAPTESHPGKGKGNGKAHGHWR